MENISGGAMPKHRQRIHNLTREIIFLFLRNSKPKGNLLGKKKMCLQRSDNLKSERFYLFLRNVKIKDVLIGNKIFLPQARKESRNGWSDIKVG